MPGLIVDYSTFISTSTILFCNKEGENMAFIINASGNETEVIPKNGTNFELDELQEAIGGYIELVSLTGGKLLIVDEEGLLKSLPINTKASMLARKPIVGTAIVCKDNQLK